ncbi:ProQ/FinO family protein [Cupriavidus agavae]|uniref:ProQ/FinO family protein n=1 Tax=Cupriavidus agavae TaxID=1001822 RepID=UPI00102BE46F|nr:ProQ/FinO family protein [Cupriavidus agavae]
MGFEQLAELRKLLAAKARQEDSPSPQAKDTARVRKAPKVRKPAQEARDETIPGPQTSPPNLKPRSPNSEVDQTVVLLGKLQKRFPLAFPKKPAPKVALKVGILEDLLGVKDELRLSAEEIRAVLSMWCRGIRYWEAMVEGAPRVALDGTVVGQVTESDAIRARQLRGRRAKPSVAKAEEPQHPDASS